MPQMQPWLVPVTVVCSCVLLLSCVVIIIIGIIIVRRRRYSSKYIRLFQHLFDFVQTLKLQSMNFCLQNIARATTPNINSVWFVLNLYSCYQTTIITTWWDKCCMNNMSITSLVIFKNLHHYDIKLYGPPPTLSVIAKVADSHTWTWRQWQIYHRISNNSYTLLIPFSCKKMLIFIF